MVPHLLLVRICTSRIELATSSLVIVEVSYSAKSYQFTYDVIVQRTPYTCTCSNWLLFDHETLRLGLDPEEGGHDVTS